MTSTPATKASSYDPGRIVTLDQLAALTRTTANYSFDSFCGNDAVITAVGNHITSGGLIMNGLRMRNAIRAGSTVTVGSLVVKKGTEDLASSEATVKRLIAASAANILKWIKLASDTELDTYFTAFVNAMSESQGLGKERIMAEKNIAVKKNIASMYVVNVVGFEFLTSMAPAQVLVWAKYKETKNLAVDMVSLMRKTVQGVPIGKWMVGKESMLAMFASILKGMKPATKQTVSRSRDFQAIMKATMKDINFDSDIVSVGVWDGKEAKVYQITQEQLETMKKQPGYTGDVVHEASDITVQDVKEAATSGTLKTATKAILEFFTGLD